MISQYVCSQVELHSCIYFTTCMYLDFQSVIKSNNKSRKEIVSELLICTIYSHIYLPILKITLHKMFNNERLYNTY